MPLKPLKSELPDPEALGLRALAFLAEDDDRLDRFLTLTGIQATQLKGIAHSPHALGAVLDYLLGFEPLLMEFAQSIDLDPAMIASQRVKLPE